MSLTDTPSGERRHIAFFGLRNAGKSSLVNAITNQEISIVSDTPGTTTDPVSKTMELLPLGPVVIIDTPGIDDVGALGEQRTRRAREVLRKADIAVLVVAAPAGLKQADRELLDIFEKRSLPCVIAYTKSDLSPQMDTAAQGQRDIPACRVSALTGQGIHALKELLAALGLGLEKNRRIVGDLLKPCDTVVLVTPIDASAPRGRLILPQQLTIRDILDAGATSLVTRETEYAKSLLSLREPPRLVITDSKVFRQIAAQTPETVPLTSFSILMARHKGTLRAAAQGVAALRRLRDGDAVLISEGCTHHRQCGDIGTVRLPAMLARHTGRQLRYEFSSGGAFPGDLSPFRLVIHCGGCMLNEREMRQRAILAKEAQIPMTNYGIAMAQMTGILGRALAPFGDNL